MFLKKVIDREIFRIVSDTADKLNIECYVVGGYVRDLLLEKKSPKDIDIVVVGDSLEFTQIVSEKLPKKQEVKYFKNFGTSMLVLDDNTEIEFVSARKESYTMYSRNPHVERGTLEDDLNRRDFTINALAISLNNNNFGLLIDLFNGLDDLKNMILRTPLDPNKTYSDDPLRMFRAIRFATQLNFKIEKESFDAIKSNKHRISILSKERIIEELNKILLSPKPSVGFLLLDQAEILENILPELTDLKGIDTIENKSHKDNFLHTLEVVDSLRKKTDKILLLWAGLLHDIGKAHTKKFDKNIGWSFHSHELVGSKMVPNIFRRLNLPMGEKMKYVQKLIKMSSRPIPLAEDTISDSAVRRFIFESGKDMDDLLSLCESDITTKNEQRLNRFLNNYKKVKEKIKLVEKRDKILNLKIPIDGQDIMKTFNIEPSREIGIIKQKIKDSILDGNIKNDYEEAFNLMIKIGIELGLNYNNENDV